MQPEPVSRRPLLIFDGDCSFCRYCVDHGRSLTRNAVVYLPYQEVATQFPHIPRERFQEAAQFVNFDGTMVSGAEAVFRALSYAARWRWVLRLYIRSHRFAAVSEMAYRWVARHRNDLSRLLGLR